MNGSIAKYTQIKRTQRHSRLRFFVKRHRGLSSCVRLVLYERAPIGSPAVLRSEKKCVQKLLLFPSYSGPSRPHLPFKCEVYRHSSFFFHPGHKARGTVGVEGSVWPFRQESPGFNNIYTHNVFRTRRTKSPANNPFFDQKRTKIGLCSLK